MSDAPQGAGWWQASDGKWYPPEQHPNRQQPASASGTTSKDWIRIGLGLVVAVVVLSLLGGLGSLIRGDDGPAAQSDETAEPSIEDKTAATLETVWSGMDTSERIRFCTEVRAAGSAVVIGEITDSAPLDEQTVSDWLELRCGD